MLDYSIDIIIVKEYWIAYVMGSQENIIFVEKGGRRKHRK